MTTTTTEPTLGRTGEPDDQGPVLLQILTDIELAVLGGNGGGVVTPFLDSLDTAEGTALYDAVTRTAFRSLLARGLIDMPTEEVLEATQQEGSEAPIEITVRDDVAAILGLRAGARAMIAIARTTDVGQDFWYAHLVDEVALVEEVGSDGLHRYLAIEVAELADLVVGATVLPEAADGSGQPVRFTAGDPTPPQALLDGLGEGYVRCDVILRKAGDHNPPLLGVFTGPRGSWLVDGARADEASVLTAGPVSVADLDERLRVLAAEAAGSAS